MKILGAFIILLTLSVPGLAAAQIVACPQFFPSGRPPIFLNPRLSQRTTFLCNDAYAVIASGVTHGASGPPNIQALIPSQPLARRHAKVCFIPRIACQKRIKRSSRITGEVAATIEAI
jgi:hypothetical protein